MSSVTKTTTYRFVDWSTYVAVFAIALVLLASIISPIFQRHIFNDRLEVKQGEVVEFKTWQLQPRLIGAMRIDVDASFNTNRWVTYELRVLDEEGNLIVSALKQAWAESGIWRQGGESGTWREKDVEAALDLRAEQDPETITLAINILDYTDTSGQPVEDESVYFRIRVVDGAIDTRYLIPGMIGTGGLALFCIFSTQTLGQDTITKIVFDSDIGGRGIMGGEDSLIVCKLKIVADETSPRFLDVNLWLTDGYGENIYHQVTPVSLIFHRDEDGDIEKTTGIFKQYFLLDKRGSYGVYIEVTPDEPVDETVLTVRENVQTLTGVSVVEVARD
ncbi:hypothetical protein E1H12_09565 [Geitlerinema sp. P-1104]|uniref:hypothetical protein n=1 Tax=Geitlerinema sp. P-1104 TaxID=2546230 RepID=UPI0014773B77|nr:hypothetical protein [Geitlerinema sp. P-1104]NMG58764.1 hypothetical protein [Geitlerinema sp. P-1104]